jgi:predicted NBD/HSP70 family sugar kinase
VDHAVTILEVLREHPRASRAELMEWSGLSPATVSRAVAKLRDEGLVRETTAGADGIGRPPRVVELDAGAAHVLGIDAGGSRIRAILADLDGGARATATATVDHPGDRRSVIETIGRVADDVRACSTTPVMAAAVGISGIVDRATRDVLLSPDLPGLEGAGDRGLLEQRLGVPTTIDNDDVLAAAGEASFGAATGCADVVFLSLGFGLGAGLLIDGRPVRGAHSGAGAIAYLAPARLEDRASGRVIPDRYAERLARGGMSASDPPARRRRGAGGRAIDAEEVFARAGGGDSVAAAVVRDVLDGLGDLVVNVAALLDPEIIVLGGGLARNATVVGSLRERLAGSVPYPARLAVSDLGDDAVAIGAVVLALAVARVGIAGPEHAAQPDPARIGSLQLV